MVDVVEESRDIERERYATPPMLNFGECFKGQLDVRTTLPIANYCFVKSEATNQGLVRCSQ
jgi:hypothetical protein